jgi:hypothetical protein
VTDLKLERSVDDFAFTVELDGERETCRPKEDRWFPLAMAICCRPAEEIAAFALARTGITVEETGFSYAEDSPDEAPPGKVRVFFQDDELILDAAYFERVLVEYMLAAQALRRSAGIFVDRAFIENAAALCARIGR